MHEFIKNEAWDTYQRASLCSRCIVMSAWTQARQWAKLGPSPPSVSVLFGLSTAGACSLGSLYKDLWQFLSLTWVERKYSMRVTESVVLPSPTPCCISKQAVNKCFAQAVSWLLRTRSSSCISPRPIWITGWVQAQPRQLSETLLPNKKWSKSKTY